MATSFEPPVVLDRLTLVTPLAIRFWDDVTLSPIADRLSVRAYPPGRPERAMQSVLNHSGIHVFYGLPGLRSVENGSGDGAFWSAQVVQKQFVLEVADTAGRYLPMSFTADAPTRNLFSLPCLSPPMSSPGVPLFSGPGRSVPPGMAIIRAELRNALTGLPAAWARVEAQHSPLSPPARGMSDALGRVTLLFPYPEPAGNPAGSPPPGAVSVALPQQEWPVDMRAWYSGAMRATELPDWCTFFAQGRSVLWSDSALTHAFTRTTIRYGRETILQSQDSGSRTELSVLLITPAGSPPAS